MSLRLASLSPVGVSPIAYSLRMAAENDFVNENEYAYSLVLITDGGESCGGNICDVVKTLIEKKIEFKPYIVSLVDYAPLKEQYNCLGNFLTVSKPGDIAPAIHTIAEAYRKVLAIPIVKTKPLPVTSIPSPSVQKISVPPVKVTSVEPETTVVIKKPELKPEPRTPTKQQTAPMKQATQDPPAPVVTTTTPSKIKVDTSFFTKEKFTPLKKYGFERINYALFWSTATPKKRPVPVFALPKPEPEPVTVQRNPQNAPAQPKPTVQQPTVATTTNKPAPKPAVIKPINSIKNEVKQADYTINLEPAPETSLEIYFTDGKGKFYTTTPPVQLIDAKTGAEVKRFYRTVDASGNPDPQKLPPGNYTLVIGKTGNYRTKSVTIQAANKNKVNIIVRKGTLLFQYEDNPKRPVKEFAASVRKTFESNTNVFQRCTDELEYEPGNYHIEINTLPVSVRNIDLDFGLSYQIDIPEPGFIQFTNANPVGKISLWAQLGDQFARFYSMELNGNVQMQNLRLQPGSYEVHWRKNGTTPMSQEGVQQFFVRSNETTQVELK